MLNSKWLASVKRQVGTDGPQSKDCQDEAVQNYVVQRLVLLRACAVESEGGSGVRASRAMPERRGEEKEREN